MHVIPLSFSRFGTVSASSATPTSSSTYPLKVSFIVLVFKNRVMIGGGGGSNSGTQSEWKSMLGHNLRDSSNQHCSQTYTFTEREPWCPAPPPSSSLCMSGEESDCEEENSSFHCFLFFGGGSAFVFGCLAFGFAVTTFGGVVFGEGVSVAALVAVLTLL